MADHDDVCQSRSDFGRRIAKALNIPNIVDVKIHVPIIGAVKVTVEFLLSEEMAQEIIGGVNG